MADNKISMDTTVPNFSNVITDIRIAKAAGYGGIELQDPHLYRYLDLGLPVSRLKEELEGIKVSSVGCLHDVANVNQFDRQYEEKAEKMCIIAAELGSPMIQATTGPTDPKFIRDYHKGMIQDDDPRYKDILGMDDPEMIRYTASGIKKVAEIAKGYGLKLVVEALAEAPVHSLKQVMRVIEETGCNNIGMLVDFWHVWNGGDSPEFIAGLDKDLIYNVHICDSVPYDHELERPIEPEMRDVWIGEGDVPIREYLDAVKHTGYDGWYTFETFCQKAWEEDLLTSAETIKKYMDMLLF